ncbi:Bug family tripartite tricarboxylate transporter substrate binding protein [Brevibacillus fulvus]|uniref:Tricarboxylic transport membrane protein n=1 Tax=Brevibacillus fulvus TaxID=1125967 RepID=A0A939BUI2_9BACL|nr:tripartite tricarboxylate transporter substrate-binding protein [Brevibacillus fulvus]MBM7589591.1 putative tricarboxylic transport membrane protein [Brevibacillus fulvus]
MLKWRIRWASLALVGAMAVSLAACSSGSNGEQQAGSSATGETYPEKQLTIVAPSGAGGAFDKAARSLAKVLVENQMVDQQILIENQPGGGGSVFLAEYATKETKNDYKLFVSSPALLINNLKKDGNSPFGYKDTTPLAQLYRDYGVIVVPANSKYNDLQTLFADLKADPKSLTLAGGSAPGSVDHLTFMLPAYKYGIDPKTIKYVSYDGKAQSMTALLGGNADILSSVAGEVEQYLKAGKVKVLAIDAPERLGGTFQDVPTIKEAGIDSELVIWRGVFGPKEMSPEAKAFWEDTLKKLSESENWKQELQNNSWQADYKTAEQFTKVLEEQNRSLQELLKTMDMAN